MSTKVYEIVTQKVLEAMTSGTAPWRKPWNGNSRHPFNGVSGRHYNGGNFFLLSLFNFQTPAFLTFNQIKKANVTIKPGEGKKHFPVFYWKWLEKKNPVNNKIEKFPMLRFFLVWNIEQLEGYELPERFKPVKGFEHDRHESADKIINGFINAPKITVCDTDRACYAPLTDTVTVPELSQYPNPEKFYATMFHELGHSTGHTSRLNRKELIDLNAFGCHDYSLEELVAELTAAFLCAESGIDNTLDNSAAYIKGWHKKLSNDPKLFWTAAGRAQKAADYILNRKAPEKESEEA